jgi:hypothetical protein
MKWLGTFNVNVEFSARGQYHSDACTLTISESFRNASHKHSAAPQFEQSALTLQMEMLAKSPDVKKL